MASRQFFNYQPKKKIIEGPISLITIDGLVVLKIIKHCEEEGASKAEVQGALLGLVTESVLEVTNCFAFPKQEVENVEDMEYQFKMLKHFRNANVDHLLVGWYQSSSYGSSLNKFDTVDSHFHYQNTIAESIVLLYDPIRTKKGFLDLRAYRLTNAAMKLKKENKFTPEVLKENNMSFTKFYEEIPIKIRNSHLVRSLMFELDDKLKVDEGKQILDLGTLTTLEKTVQTLMKSVDRLVITHKQQMSRQQTVRNENAARAARGEKPLTEEEVNKILQNNTQDEKLENMLAFSQTLNYCNQASQYSTQNLGKFFMSKSLSNSS